MKILIVIIILGLFAIIGSRLSYLNSKSFLGFKNIIFTGIEYIFAGLLLGEMGLDILDRGSMASMEPFMIFGICWVGFLLGLQLKVSEIKKLPKNYFMITLITTLICFFFVSGLMYLIISFFPQVPQTKKLFLSLILGAISANTAQSALAVIQKNCRFKNHDVIRLLRYISGMDGVISIILFALILSIFSEPALIGAEFSIDLSSAAKVFVFSTLIGVGAAIILILLTKFKTDQNELILFLVGVVLFFGGYASCQGFSPLFTGLICGIIFANLSRLRMRAMLIVIHSEKAFYIIILLILGATWEFSFNLLSLLGIIFVLLRIGGKGLGAFVGTTVMKHSRKIPPWVGLGLLSEGGLSIVMVISFKMIHPMSASLIVSVVVISAIINELISPRLIFNLFRNEEMEEKNKEILRELKK
jgi:Kef-type K+ transport system membrane component KefB